MTRDFLKRVKAAGHSVFGVLDEHNAEDWERVFQEADMSAEWNALQIYPVSQDTGKIKSSGALCLSLFGDEVDEHVKSLCEAADAADRMDYSTKFGSLVNSAVKSRIQDDTRRVYMAKHFASNSEPDEVISKWIEEYEKILENHKEILTKAQDLGDGIVRMSTVGLAVDMTSLMKEVYDRGFILAVCEGEFYSKDLGKKVTQIGFGLDSRKSKLNLVDILASVGIVGNGFAAKVNVLPEQEQTATEAIRTAIRS
jgi:hypothetical protein